MNQNKDSKFNIEELNALMGITKVINSTLAVDDVLNTVLTELQRVIDSDAATIWLINEKTEFIEPRVVSGTKSNLISSVFLKRGEGIAGKVIEQKEASLVTDVLQDPNWTNRVDSITGFTTRSILTVPIICNDKSIGCFQLVNKREGNLFSKDDLRFAMSVANLSALIITNAQLYEEQKSLMMSITRTLTAAIDARDPYTKGHSERVKRIALKIGEKIGFNNQNQMVLEIAAFLHDVGKIGVPDDILSKPDKLSENEFSIVKEHSKIGANIISQIEPSMKDAYQVALFHQEKFDGSGYPMGLKANNIPLMARIVAVADAFDAMTSNRPYKKAMNIEEAVQELIKNKGIQFDPELVDEVLTLIDEGGIVKNEYI